MYRIRFTTPAGAMHYVDEGNGEPIVFVHGNPAWSFEFRKLIKELSRTNRCIAPDLIGGLGYPINLPDGRTCQRSMQKILIIFLNRHTEAIIASDQQAVERFFHDLDSAILLHNASTQYAGGGEFGMGAEIGIATGRIHARGPVGAEQLTSFKYLVRGGGQSRP